MSEVQEIVLPQVRPDEDVQLEPQYRVIIHNDNVTTFEYVISILTSVFLLSSEIAEHVAWTAHEKGLAVVVIRPQTEAEKLAAVANSRARADGYPLTFTTEPED